MNTSKYFAGGLAITSILVAAPAFAQTTSNVDLKGELKTIVAAHIGSSSVSARVNASTTAQTKIANAIDLANKEITRRISALTDLTTKVQAMVRVSSTEKTTLSNEVQTEISALNTLKAKIDAETDLTVLKTDVQSITKDYRIFMLIIPQGRIEVTADRIQTIAGLYPTLATKLQARISAGQTAGKDVTSVNATLSDMNAKVADANAKAQAAVALVANLQPDQGVQATIQSNQAALKSARADLKTALQDLRTARQDAGVIVRTVEAWRLNASASSTVSTK